MYAAKSLPAFKQQQDQKNCFTIRPVENGYVIEVTGKVYNGYVFEDKKAAMNFIETNLE